MKTHERNCWKLKCHRWPRLNRKGEGGTMEEECGGIMKEKSWRRNREEGIMKKESWRSHHGGCGKHMEESERHPVNIWETSGNHLGGLCEAPGDTWEAPGAAPGVQGLQGSLGGIWEKRGNTSEYLFRQME